MTPDLQVGRVDIGVAQLHVRCYGKGSPTVVFNAGPGDMWVTWEQVMSEVAKFTRVCAYDRAGVGSSSPGPKPRTSQQMADEFALLLEKGNIPGPYVLVSHSTSNWIDRLYTAQHRDQVAALVFVSPFHEGFISGILAILDPYPDDLAIARNEIAAQGEGQSVDDWLVSADQVHAAGPLGDLPLILLIHSRSPQGSEPYAKQVDAMLAQQEQLLLALSVRSARLQSDQSSFRIQTADSQAVVEAVRQAISLTLSRATPTRMPNSK
jgi:pimeloyl-ACP methyl ester carboxylesterase